MLQQLNLTKQLIWINHQSNPIKLNCFEQKKKMLILLFFFFYWLSFLFNSSLTFRIWILLKTKTFEPISGIFLSIMLNFCLSYKSSHNLNIFCLLLLTRWSKNNPHQLHSCFQLTCIFYLVIDYHKNRPLTVATHYPT